MGAPITEEQFEASRIEAGNLVTGTVADWNAASDEAKTTYSIASAMPLLSGSGTTEQRGAMGAVFRRCMDAEVARSAPTALLGDVSYTCAMAIQNGAQR